MSNLVTNNAISRLRRRFQNEGIKGTVSGIVKYARRRTYLDETHVWYELPLEVERPRRDLSPELTLIKAGPEHVHLLGQMPTVSEAAARERMDGGADLWIVLDGDRAVFACWIFHKSMPMLAAPDGILPLPPQTVCLENSVTAADYRGRSIAPAAWFGIADTLERAGVHSIITKIEESNIPSRKAVSKVGFEEIATMHFRLLGPSRKTTVTSGTGATASWLAEQLQR